MTSKEAIDRELKYELCGSGGALYGLVAEDHVSLDERLEPDSERPASDYPWLLFRRAGNPEEKHGLTISESFEFEIVGLQTDADKGDELLESIKDKVRDHFNRKRKTWGKFTEEGIADPNGGLLMTAVHIDTDETFNDALGEKSQIVTIKFAYLAS